MSLVRALPSPGEGGDDYATWIANLVPARFRADVVGPDPEGAYSHPPCSVPNCPRVSTSMPERLCRPHRGQQRVPGAADGDVDALTEARPVLVSRRSQQGDATMGVFRLSLASNPVVRAELGFGLSLRATRDGGAPLRAHIFNTLARALSEVGVDSVLDARTGSSARELVADRCGGAWPSARALLDQLITTISDLRGDDTARVVIGTRRGGSKRYTTRQRIPQPWLRDLVRRWCQYRLNTEAAAPQHLGQQESMLVEFAIWCQDQDVESPRDFTRPLLLRWLGHVQAMLNPDTGKVLSGAYRGKYVGAVENFVAVVRAEFDDRVPSNAGYLRGERPSRDVPTPRYLEPRVIDTLRREENLLLIPDRAHRLVIRIMMHVGLRAGHTCALPFECLLDLNRNGTVDKWALTFVDTKSNRNVTLPIDPEVAAAIREQQQAVRAASEGPRAPELLFPNPRAYKTGRLAPEAVNVALGRWVAALNLREANGELVNVTPHRFRHTFATEMLDRGVPVDVVRELLGHRSLASTQVYATVTEARLRGEWEKSRVVDVRGESIAIATGEAGDAEWLLHRIGKAVQPLPNGYCGLPIQQACPHANACLDCDHFMTSKEFLPVLRQQHEEHARFVSKAEREGHLRLAEINRRPMRNLERIIGAVEDEAGA